MSIISPIIQIYFLAQLTGLGILCCYVGLTNDPSISNPSGALFLGVWLLSVAAIIILTPVAIFCLGIGSTLLLVRWSFIAAHRTSRNFARG